MIKNKLVLYCCTFSRDLKITYRMINSLVKYNKDNIPCYMSVPTEDLELFKPLIEIYPIKLIDEKKILLTNSKLNTQAIYNIPGSLRQQIIKSEFWRLGITENYLVLDADCVFIKDFYISDFLVEGDIPYSIIHQGRKVLQHTALFKNNKHRSDFFLDRTPIKKALGRQGVIYDYGYAPFIWNKKVWESLDINYLTPNRMNFLDAILFCPSEFTWYGEALTKFNAIPIFPKEEIFKHYHYESQLWLDKILGYTKKIISMDYLGIVYQSNWEVWLHYGSPSKPFFSRQLRSIKRYLRKIYFTAYLFYKLICNLF